MYKKFLPAEFITVTVRGIIIPVLLNLDPKKLEKVLEITLNTTLEADIRKIMN
jgi:hypothetical protein